jgi:hypothetical protein
MSGSIHDHDDLSEALADYRASEDAACASLMRLKALAERCGMAPDEPTPIAWVRRRIATYRRMFDVVSVTGAEPFSPLPSGVPSNAFQ